MRTLMLNRIVIMGRLGHEPEVRYTQSGKPVASFSLAVDRDFKDKASGERATDWIDVVATPRPNLCSSISITASRLW